MKQLLRNLKNGTTEIVEVPSPGLGQGQVSSRKSMEKRVEEVLDILLYGIAERVKLNRRKAVSS